MRIFSCDCPASVFYCYCAALGLDVHPEEQTSKGRIDLVLRFEGRGYLLEFKVVELAGTEKALQQIKDKRYNEKYTNREIYLIGVEFSSREGNIVGFDWKKVD